MNSNNKLSKIAFAKIGKSLKFCSAYSPVGGDNEGPALLRILANHNPDKTFYIVGRSDFHKLDQRQRLELFPYDNVVDCWAGFRGPAKQEHVRDYFDRNGQPDAFIAMPGQIGTVTIQGIIQQVKDRSLIASVIDMTKNYTSPITFWMNEVKPYTVEIINDPRYDLAQSRDIIKVPDVSLSQYDYFYVKNNIKSYADQDRIETNVNVKYAGMEKIFMYGRKREPIDVSKRTTNFMVVLNEGSPSRYDMLNDWVLKDIKDVEIYGRWEDERALKDPRFKGSMQLEDLQNKLKTVRCSFIIPIAPGWVTSKYIELIQAGVIPILHPSYDTQNHTTIPEYLRPKNLQELKMLLLSIENDTFYSLAIGDLQSFFCTKEAYSGSAINQAIFNAIDNSYQQVDLSEYKKKEIEPEGLDSFFG